MDLVDLGVHSQEFSQFVRALDDALDRVGDNAITAPDAREHGQQQQWHVTQVPALPALNGNGCHHARPQRACKAYDSVADFLSILIKFRFIQETRQNRTPQRLLRRYRSHWRTFMNESMRVTYPDVGSHLHLSRYSIGARSIFTFLAALPSTVLQRVHSNPRTDPGAAVKINRKTTLPGLRL
jgi:hypothetical protein